MFKVQHHLHLRLATSHRLVLPLFFFSSFLSDISFQQQCVNISLSFTFLNQPAKTISHALRPPRSSFRLYVKLLRSSNLSVCSPHLTNINLCLTNKKYIHIYIHLYIFFLFFHFFLFPFFAPPSSFFFIV